MSFRPKKILVATDFSANAALALEDACDLAAAFQAQLTVFHVALPSTYIELAAGLEGSVANTLSYQDAFQESLEREQKAIDAQLAARGQTAAWKVSYGGQPAHQIVAEAAEGPYDAVVMGTLGRTGLQHLLLGSVAEAVVRHCAVPVLTVCAR